MPDLSNPTKPASATLEGKLATAGVILGAVLAGLTTTFGMLAHDFPAIGWIGVLAGMFSVGASVVGLNKSRGQVKAADIFATAAQAIAAALGPQAGLSALGIQTQNLAAPTTPLIAPPGSLTGTPPPK